MFRLSPYLEENYYEIYCGRRLQEESNKQSGSCKAAPSFAGVQEISVVSKENLYEKTIEKFKFAQKTRKCAYCGNFEDPMHNGMESCKTCKRGYCEASCLVTLDCCSARICEACCGTFDENYKSNRICSDCMELQESGLVNISTQGHPQSKQKNASLFNFYSSNNSKMTIES